MTEQLAIHQSADELWSVEFVPAGAESDFRLMESTTFVGHEAKKRAFDYAKSRHPDAYNELIERALRKSEGVG